MAHPIHSGLAKAPVFTSTSHFFCSPFIMAPAPSGASFIGLSCHVWGIPEGGVDSWSMQPAQHSEANPLSSFKIEHLRQQPAAQGREMCFKICACRTCQHPGTSGQAALGQNSFAHQSCFREVGGLYVGPTLP